MLSCDTITESTGGSCWILNLLHPYKIDSILDKLVEFLEAWYNYDLKPIIFQKDNNIIFA